MTGAELAGRLAVKLYDTDPESFYTWLPENEREAYDALAAELTVEIDTAILGAVRWVASNIEHTWRQHLALQPNRRRRSDER